MRRWREGRGEGLEVKEWRRQTCRCSTTAPRRVPRPTSPLRDSVRRSRSLHLIVGPGSVLRPGAERPRKTVPSTRTAALPPSTRYSTEARPIGGAPARRGSPATGSAARRKTSSRRLPSLCRPAQPTLVHSRHKPDRARRQRPLRPAAPPPDFSASAPPCQRPSTPPPPRAEGQLLRPMAEGVGPPPVRNSQPLTERGGDGPRRGHGLLGSVVWTLPSPAAPESGSGCDPAPRHRGERSLPAPPRPVPSLPGGKEEGNERVGASVASSATGGAPASGCPF